MRPLPDPDLSLRDACDFIFDSALARKALECPHPANLSNFLRELIYEISRLSLSCHLPEFTDHGLSHLCSLIDRISRWSMAGDSLEEFLVVQQEMFTSEHATVLLLATLIHDLGMLSQRPEDMPSIDDQLGGLALRDVPTWVRHTHIKRLPNLLRRMLERTCFEVHMNELVVARAIFVAQAHGKWPWDWDCFSFRDRDAGLAAMLAVADLLDEDAMRCDSSTLLKHRLGTSLNCAHWLRHGLTNGRVIVSRGRVSVKLARPPDVDAQMLPVFDALRNHYRLVMLYVGSLELVGAGLLGVDFNPTHDIPDAISSRLRGWNQLPEFRTQSSLRFHLLDSFMPEALLDQRRLGEDVLSRLTALHLSPIPLDNYYEIRSTVPPRTDLERAFHALISE